MTGHKPKDLEKEKLTLNDSKDELTAIQYACTFRKFDRLIHGIADLRVKDKRHLFQLMRNHRTLSEHTFFPMYSMTAGEFAMGNLLTETIRKSKDAPVPE